MSSTLSRLTHRTHRLSGFPLYLQNNLSQNIEQAEQILLSTQVCSVWLPVDPVSKHTCLRLVKGSHSSPHYFKPVHFDGPPFTLYEIKPGDEGKAEQFLSAPDIDGDQQFQVLSWEMEVIGISHAKSLCTPRRIISGSSSWHPAAIWFFNSFTFLVQVEIIFCQVKRLWHLPV